MKGKKRIFEGFEKGEGGGGGGHQVELKPSRPRECQKAIWDRKEIHGEISYGKGEKAMERSRSLSPDRRKGNIASSFNVKHKTSDKKKSKNNPKSKVWAGEVGKRKASHQTDGFGLGIPMTRPQRSSITKLFSKKGRKQGNL